MQNLIQQVVEKYDASLEARRRSPLEQDIETVAAFAVLKYAAASSSSSTTQPDQDMDEGAGKMQEALLRLEARHFQRQHSLAERNLERMHGEIMMIEMEEAEMDMMDFEERNMMDFELATRMQGRRALEIEEEAAAITRQAAIRQAFANVLSESRVPISLGTADELEQRIDRARAVYGEYEALVTEARQTTSLRNALLDIASVQSFHLNLLVIGVLANQVALLTWNANSKLCELALLLGHLAPEERSVDVEWTFSSLKERFNAFKTMLLRDRIGGAEQPVPQKARQVLESAKGLLTPVAHVAGVHGDKEGADQSHLATSPPRRDTLRRWQESSAAAAAGDSGRRQHRALVVDQERVQGKRRTVHHAPKPMVVDR